MLFRLNDGFASGQMFEDFRRQLERLFDEPGFRGVGDWPGNLTDARPLYNQGYWPRVLVSETDSRVTLRMEVPGLTEQDVKISLLQDVLTISGERKVKKLEGYTAHRHERPSYGFSRSFTLPPRTDTERIQAKLADGVLTITMERQPETPVRQIPVNA